MYKNPPVVHRGIFVCKAFELFLVEKVQYIYVS